MGTPDPQLVWPVGMMMLMLAALAVPFHLAKQSQIIAMIVVGVVFKQTGLDVEMRLSKDTAASLFDLGILFVLFMGGMEVDLNALKKGWNLVLINGLGQITLNFGIFIGIGAALFAQETEVVGLVYFGLCCTLSSTILVLGCLKKRGEMEAMHGQIILGLMVMQDVCAVVAIALMAAFDPNAKGVDIASSIGYILLWMVVLVICLVLLNRFVLNALFRYCAVSTEMLFIAVYAYSVGVAAVFGHFLPKGVGRHMDEVNSSFSQEIGIFFAGVSIAALEYRVQIETFVEPIKEFGVLLFFFILGIDLPLGEPQVLIDALLPSLLLAGLTVFVCPALLWITGAISGLDSRCSFLLGNTVNQISEFSLILASMAIGLGIFNKRMYLTIVISTLITFIFSSMGHVFADQLYEKVFRRLLWFLDDWCRVKPEEAHEFVMEDHVVLLGFNAIALEIAEYYRESAGKDVMLIQLDPALHAILQDSYVQGHAAAALAAKNAPPQQGSLPQPAPKAPGHAPKAPWRGWGGDRRLEETGREEGGWRASFDSRRSFDSRGSHDSGAPRRRAATNIFSQYADPTNPDTWHHYNLHHASMVVSCGHGTTESDCVLAADLKQHSVPFLCIADSNAEARVLYDHGARFVIQTNEMAAMHFQRFLYDAKLSRGSFLSDVASRHKKRIDRHSNDEIRALLADYM